MSGWRPASSATPGAWGTSPSDSWCDWKPERPNSLGCKLIIPDINDAMLLEEVLPMKICAL